jgi:bacterioferritin-associated ferredoxin
VWVCLCEGVTRSTILKEIANGARSVAEIGGRCGAGTVCGKCQGNIALLLREELEREAQPDLRRRKVRRGWTQAQTS